MTVRNAAAAAILALLLGAERKLMRRLLART